MKKLNLHEMYILGKRLAPLDQMRSDTKLSTVVFDLWTARISLREALGSGSPLLVVARRAAEKLVSAIGSLVSDNVQDALNVDKEKTCEYYGYRIKEDFDAFESVLTNEMPGVPAYIVSEKGIYKTEALIDYPVDYFPLAYHAEIPKQAKFDFSEAGKCLAYEIPTACSFHLWRAVETVMGAYYEALTGKKFTQKNWAAKIQALEAAKAEKSITEFLDHIRDQYRNPQTHPDAMVDDNEALMLFGAAASSINQMIGAILKIRAKTAPS